VLLNLAIHYHISASGYLGFKTQVVGLRKPLSLPVVTGEGGNRHNLPIVADTGLICPTYDYSQLTSSIIAYSLILIRKYSTEILIAGEEVENDYKLQS